jgi:hypothetical protein
MSRNIASLAVRFGVALLVVVSAVSVGVAPVAAASDDCDNDDQDCDSGDAGFNTVESFLSEWGTTIDLVDMGVGGGGGNGGYIDPASQ